MLKTLINAQLAKFERRYQYDMSYAREILEADLGAFLKFSRLLGFSQHATGVPAEALFTAKLLATLQEDCGPCTQLMVNMADEAHVDAAVLRAVIARKPEQLPPDAQLAYRFTEAALAHSLDADTHREEIVRRWGKRGLVTLSFGIVSGRLYPTLKYALGHGKTCTRVKVGEDSLAPGVH